MLKSEESQEKVFRLDVSKILMQNKDNISPCLPKQKSFTVADGYAIQMNRMSNNGAYYLGQPLPEE